MFIKGLALLLSKMPKLIRGVLVLSTLIFSVSPFANCEIKAMSISLDILQDSPCVLNVVSMSQLDDLILQGMFSDKKTTGSDTHRKSGFVTANYDFCMTGLKTVIDTQASVFIKTVPDVRNSENRLVCGVLAADYGVFGYGAANSFCIGISRMSEWLTVSAMPRGYSESRIISNLNTCKI